MLFKVYVSVEQYGHILIEADNEEQAREQVESGEYTDDMFHVKNGGTVVEDITLIKE